MAATSEKPTVDTSALDAYTVHEAAAMFPILDAENLQRLAHDIDEHGQHEPVWLHQGQLLDGRNRVLACALVGRKPITQEWKPQPGETPASFVMSRNIHRRHLNASQRAAIAVDLEALIARENKQLREQGKTAATGAGPAFSHPDKGTVSVGGGGGTEVRFTSGDPTDQAEVGARRPTTGRARDQAAQAMNVSAGYVNDAKDLKKASPERFEQVRSGALSLARAQEEVVSEAQSQGTLEDLKLRPGTVRSTLARIEADRAPARPPQQKPDPIKLPKATKVKSSATPVTITATFGNPGIAEEYLNQMQEDTRVLDLDYTVLDKRPGRSKSR